MHVSNFLILFWIIFNIIVLLKNPYARVKFLVPYSGAVCSFFSFLLGMVNYWGWREHRYREDNQNQNPNLSHQTHLPNSNAIFIVYSKISNFCLTVGFGSYILIFEFQWTKWWQLLMHRPDIDPQHLKPLFSPPTSLSFPPSLPSHLPSSSSFSRRGNLFSLNLFYTHRLRFLFVFSVVGFNGFLVICGAEPLYCFRLSGKSESFAKNMEIIHFRSNIFFVPVISETGVIGLS